MSKRPLRVIVVLFALAFSLAGTSVVTVARDGIAPVKRKIRNKRNKKTHRPNHGGQTNNNPGGQEDPSGGGGGGGSNRDKDPHLQFARNRDRNPDTADGGGGQVAAFFGGVAKVGRKVGRIFSGKGSKGTSSSRGGGPRDPKNLDF